LAQTAGVQADEKALIRAAQEGDQDAFGQLVRAYDKSVLRLAMNLLHSPEDAQDVYQEAFLRVYRNLNSFRFDCSFHSAFLLNRSSDLEGDTVSSEGLPEHLHTRRDLVRETLLSGELSIKKTVRIIEEELIRRALEATRGNRTNASKKLEISHRALLYKMKAYGVSGPSSGPVSGTSVGKFDDEG